MLGVEPQIGDSGREDRGQHEPAGLEGRRLVRHAATGSACPAPAGAPASGVRFEVNNQ
jgi:hypothetical protein